MNKEEIPIGLRTKCQVFSRVVGYYRPVSQWNDGKVSEFKDRKEFKIERSDIDGSKKI